MGDFDAIYGQYLKEAEAIMSREKTATMTMPNKAEPSDPKDWARPDVEETEAFWEKCKCLTL